MEEKVYRIWTVLSAFEGRMITMKTPLDMLLMAAPTLCSIFIVFRFVGSLYL